MEKSALYSVVLLSVLAACESNPQMKKNAKETAPTTAPTTTVGTTTNKSDDEKTTPPNNGSNSGNTSNNGDSIKGGCYLQDQESGAQTCIEYVSGLTNGTQDQIRQGCEQHKGSFYPSGCPSANRVGSCDFQSNNLTLSLSFYSGVTVEQAQEFCQQMNGKFHD